METAEDLVAKHTRRELEDMAEKLGISTMGVSKAVIAGAILETRKKTSIKAPGQMIGKKGVFAKRAAIDAQMKENEAAAAKMELGIKEVHKSVREFHKSIDAQVKENEKAAAKMDSGVKEVHKGIREFHKSIDAQVKENEKAAAKMDSGVKEMHKGIDEVGNSFRAFQTETANYVKEFYYG